MSASEDLLARKAKFKAEFDRGIGKQGVPWPGDTQHTWALMFLWEAGEPGLTQQEIIDLFAKHNLGHYDRQIRHKAVQGWPLFSSRRRSTNMLHCSKLRDGAVALRSLDTRNPLQTASRKVVIKGVEWDEKVRLFEEVRGGCACCGKKFAHYDKAHLDRSKDPTGDNVVPMCTNCNNWFQAKNLDAYLDEQFVARPVVVCQEKHKG